MLTKVHCECLLQAGIQKSPVPDRAQVPHSTESAPNPATFDRPHQRYPETEEHRNDRQGPQYVEIRAVAIVRDNEFQLHVRMLAIDSHQADTEFWKGINDSEAG
jgi:hypothetical protein